ncbi:Os03g0124700 [Oryza sativa Japonica Group]|uniref:Os03g0124700 protein n=1 Tax=Oryza sativa subsp. japonica TaxID=39947 RepID=A0A0P0VSG7_ORYSJ|nr:Os03g0124700 [Oryza sativa Japonica Group]
MKGHSVDEERDGRQQQNEGEGRGDISSSSTHSPARPRQPRCVTATHDSIVDWGAPPTPPLEGGHARCRHHPSSPQVIANTPPSISRLDLALGTAMPWIQP